MQKEIVFPLLVFYKYKPILSLHKKEMVHMFFINNLEEIEWDLRDSGLDTDLEQDVIVIDSLGRKMRVKIDCKTTLLEVTESIINMDDIEIQDAEDWYQMGLAFLQGDAYDLAIKAFSKAIGLRADYDRAYLYRGMAYQMLGDKGKAENDFRKVLEILEARKDLGIGMGNRKKIVEKDLELRAAAILALKALKGK